MPYQKSLRREKIKLAALTVFVFLIALVLIGIVIHGMHERAGQAAALERQALANCREIERLKAGARMEATDTYREGVEAALRSFAELDETLRLLNIQRTPDLTQEAVRQRNARIERAAVQRDRKLALYAEDSCPRELPPKENT